MKRLTLSAMFLATVLAAPCHAEPRNPNTDWFHAAKYGGFMHCLPGNDAQLALVKSFDTAVAAQQLEEVGAKYLVITLGQNSGYFISPNATYDRVTRYAPGERCSSRDLPMDLSQAPKTKGVKLVLYLPCQVPNRDERAQRAFGLPQAERDQPIDLPFADKWSAVIQEWADRYGDRVAGWWFDGGYARIKCMKRLPISTRRRSNTAIRTRL